MKRILALLTLTVSLLSLVGCALIGGNKTDNPSGDPSCAHSETVWEYMSGATCDMQYVGSTVFVQNVCNECGAYIRGVELSCDEFILHKPDDNGYCEDCQGYDLVPSVYADASALSYSWEADGVKYSFSYSEDKFSYVEASADNTVEKYYSTKDDGYGNITEISKKTYENGRITESRTLTYDAAPSEFLENEYFIYDMIRLIGVMDPRNPDVRFEKTGTVHYPVSYNNKGEIIKFNVPLNVYSIYYTEDGTEKLVSSGVAMFDDRIVSFTDERGDEPVVYTFDNELTEIIIPQKEEDEFFLALRELEKYELFSEYEYVLDQTIVTTVGEESVTEIQKVVNNANGATFTHSGGNSSVITKESDGVYMTTYRNGEQTTKEKIDGDFLEAMKIAMTLNGIGYTINTYFYAYIYDFSYSDGMATFTLPGDSEAYLRVFIEDGRVVRCEKFGSIKTSDGMITSVLDTIVINYGANQ